MKNIQKTKRRIRKQRARRTRAALSVTHERPRLSVFRSLKHIRAQVIAPGGKVLLAVSDTHLKNANELSGVAKAKATGIFLAEKAKIKKITYVAFDKAHYKYHGRVKAFADGAREGGLKF